MRYLFGFVCVLALGVMGCETTDGGGGGGVGGDGGSGGDGVGGDGGTGVPIESGLWLGGDPATNTNGDEFDTGWAICFHVNEDGSALTPSTDCDIDGDDEDAYSLEISWKDDVGKNEEEEPCNTDDWKSVVAFGETDIIPIEDGSFTVGTGDDGLNIEGTFDGDTATGTAGVQIQVTAFASCALDGGWTASPVVTDCTGAQDRTDCRPPRVGFSCLYEHCVANQCDDVADGTLCGWQLIGDAYLRVCEAGMCAPTEDCTGIPDGVECTGGDGGFCEGGECVAPL